MDEKTVIELALAVRDEIYVTEKRIKDLEASLKTAEERGDRDKTPRKEYIESTKKSIARAYGRDAALRDVLEAIKGDFRPLQQNS